MSTSAVDELRMQAQVVNATGAAAGIVCGILETLPDASAAVVASDLAPAQADEVAQALCAAARAAVRRAIAVRFDRAGLTIAFAQRDVHLELCASLEVRLGRSQP